MNRFAACSYLCCKRERFTYYNMQNIPGGNQKVVCWGVWPRKSCVSGSSPHDVTEFLNCKFLQFSVL